MPRARLAVGVAAIALTVLFLASAFSPAGGEVRAPSGANGVSVHPFHPADRPSLSGVVALASAARSLAAGEGPGRGGVSCPAGAPGPVPSAFCRLGSHPGLPRTGGASGWKELGAVELRYTGTMAYDAADGYVLEFGGYTDSGSTWKYANGAWSNLTSIVVGVPPPRFAEMMAFDPPLGKIVMFGGTSPTAKGFGAMNDTWTYRAGTWVNVSTTVGAPPPGRGYGGFAYDANDSADVLFGGDNAGTAIPGTWEFNGTRWTNVSANQTASPPPSLSPSLAADATDGDVVFFGGGASVQSPWGNGTWTFTGNTWANVSTASSHAPPLRAYPSLTEDSTGGGVVLFGGFGSGNTEPGLIDTWRFVHGGWNRIATGPTTPAPRIQASTSDDPGSFGILLSGGTDEINGSLLSDTWELSSSHWTPVANGSSPNPRTAASMAYDSTTHEVILFGGSGENDTWSFQAGTWTRLHPSRSPVPRLFGALSDDPADSELVLFGGDRVVPGPSPLQFLGDTWVWANGTWSNITSTARGPPARALASIAFDSSSQVVVLYGGANQARGFQDTWTFHAGQWTVASPATSPHASYGGALADDPADYGVVLFGGTPFRVACATSVPPPSRGSYCAETWTFTNGSWSNRTTSTTPPGRTTAGLVYDPVSGSDVLYGGVGTHCASVANGSGCVTQFENDTWSYSAGQWTNRTRSVGPPPDPGVGSAFVEDAVDGYAFLFADLAETPTTIASGSWWSLTPTPATPALTVGIPTASSNPVTVGGSTNLTVVITGGALPETIAWNNLPGGCPTVNTSTLLCSPTGAGTYPVSVTVSDAHGTVVTGGTLLLTVTNRPVLGSVTVSPSTAQVAVGGIVNFTAQPRDSSGQPLPGALVNWSFANTGLATFNRSTGTTVTMTAGSTPVDLELLVSAEYHGETVSAFAVVTIFEHTGAALAISSFVASPPTIALGATTVFSTVPTGGTAPYNYTYTGLPTPCGNSYLASFPCTPNAAGSSRVQVTVTDFAGAVQTANVTVQVTGASGVTTSSSVPTVDYLVLGGAIAAIVVGSAVLILRRPRYGRGPPGTAPPPKGGPPGGTGGPGT